MIQLLIKKDIDNQSVRSQVIQISQATLICSIGACLEIKIFIGKLILKILVT